MRHGGASTGAYAEMNINYYCGDDPQAIAENRRLLCSELGIADSQLLYPHQTHGCKVVEIDRELLALPSGEQQQRLDGVDAVVTRQRGICIGVSTADCIPIIIYDPRHHAVAAVHAGWRGTVQRIARDAMLAMITAYGSNPSQLQVVIGPGISIEAFEVGDEVYDVFAAANFPMEAISRRMPAMDGTPIEKWHIDLWACNRLQLQAVGVLPEHIHVSGICTWQQSDDYFSARRLGIQSGRILTAAILR
jgi:YfiH family protein